MLRAVDSTNNSITFCTGSYRTNPSKDLLEIIEAVKGRIHFVHASNVEWIGNLSFQETSHLARDGS
ncbi:mannonate dehydratase [Lentibacillus jeotgali]|uniref:mannonate dehydratase n=1 Tax=Lentibacillus jeotgali TaxID=558169 RepID=UPI002479FC09|nr:mannonate dehydratase [Lentibacillus jeotgali]